MANYKVRYAAQVVIEAEFDSDYPISEVKDAFENELADEIQKVMETEVIGAENGFVDVIKQLCDVVIQDKSGEQDD